MITAHVTSATDLLQRVHVMTLREWCVAAGVMSLVLAIAWIGRNVSRLLESQTELAERVRIAEGNLTNAQDAIVQLDESITRVDEAVAKRCRNVEARQERLQSKVDNWGKSWRDSGQSTKDLRFTGPQTIIDLGKP